MKDDFAGFPERFREVAVMAVQDKNRAHYVRGMDFYYEMDYPKAMENFRLAAVHAVGEAEFQIGLMYFQGQGVRKNLAEAADWFKRATANGGFMGTIYLELLKRDLDTQRQRIWLAEIFFQIGNLGFEDPAVRESQGYFEKDPGKALDMLIRAAAMGHGNALSRVGEIFENALGGIAADPVVGLAMVILLADKSEDFLKLLGRLLECRSAPVVLQAIRLVRELVKPGNFEIALQRHLRNPAVLPALEVTHELDAPASIPAMTDTSTCLVEDREDTSTITQQNEVLCGKLKASTLAVQDMLRALDWIQSAGKEGASAGVLEAYAKHTAQETRAALGLQE